MSVKRRSFLCAACVLVATVVSAGSSSAGLVARWDFNNYDSENPSSANVLKATVGSDASPCRSKDASGSGSVVTETLGDMTVISSDYAGTDQDYLAAAKGLVPGNCALAVPLHSHVSLPIPASMKNHPWSIKIRFFAPTASWDVYRSFFNLPPNLRDGGYFICKAGRDNALANSLGGGAFGYNGNYTTPVSSNCWHTLFITQGNTQLQIVLDEKTVVCYNTAEKLNYFSGSDSLLLFADNDGDDELLFVDYVEFYDEGGVLEGVLPVNTKAAMTGEWTFSPGDDILKASVGRDLEKYTRTGAEDFAETADGVAPGDTGLRVGQNNGLRCYHSLTSGADYTVVMDVRIPRTEVATVNYHGLFQPLSANNDDAEAWLRSDGSKYTPYLKQGAVAAYIDFGEWRRIVLTCENSKTVRLYDNGQFRYSKDRSTMKAYSGGYFLLLTDNDGEDYDTDISYAAIYDRVLTDAEVAELHSRPQAHLADGTAIPTVEPVGRWEKDGDAFTAVVGAALTAENGAYVWERASAPDAATYVFDVTLPTTQPSGGALVGNANGIVSGVCGTSASLKNGALATTDTDATFASGTVATNWGAQTFQTLDRTAAHQVAVCRTAAGAVRYYVDGRAWGQLYPSSVDLAAKPTATMTFLKGFESGVTAITAYDAVLTPGEIGALVHPVERPPEAAAAVLTTWPWQQNVYTNRFTIICETKKQVDGLEIQYGSGYTRRQTMTCEAGLYLDGNYLYKAHIVADDLAGEEIPYRLGVDGVELTYTDPAESTAGVVKLWKDEEAPFSCSIWGDNQQGAKAYDWDSDKYAYIRAMFRHMLARNVDFGLSTGDMSSSGQYKGEIVPGVLIGTNGEFGRVKPYYVAWGNHDSIGSTKQFFETPAADDPDYRDSAHGNSYLYRNNVLIVFIDNALQGDEGTKTWLATLLNTERAKRAKFRILLQHCPVFGECWGRLSAALLETIKAGGVDVVFSGHMHGYERIERDGFVQLTNGGAGYLDHVESIVNDYGADTKVGGHQNTPYLWARQKSRTETGVLGGAEPVRMGCIQSYGELRVEGDTLTYLAHGFDANGGYIGVFDSFTLKSKSNVVAASPASPSPVFCADNAAFDAFTEKPVDNAAWKIYKEAVGEPFDCPVGRESDPVVNVSKREIETFCRWLNGADGAGGSYRLPTLGELTAIFDGDLVRTVSEWTSTVDANTGWCRILGSPAKATAGTWSREGDKPSIATADCHADYLGFRLATGPRPEEPDALSAPLEAFAAIETPASVYKWENGALVDISQNWTETTVYDVPVVIAAAGAVNLANAAGTVFNAGLAAPNATELRFTGAVTLKGPVKGGRPSGGQYWTISCAALTLDNATYEGQTFRAQPQDGTVSLTGVNDFSGAVLLVGSSSDASTLVSTAGAAKLKARSLSMTGTCELTVAADVTLELADTLNYKADGATFVIDGLVDAGGVEALANVSPRFLGSGTLRTAHFTAYQNSALRLGVSNVVLTTGNPWRHTMLSSEYRVRPLGARVCLTSLYPWAIGEKDNWGQTFVWQPDDAATVPTPTLVFAGDQTIGYAPARAECAVEVGGGTVRIGKSPSTVSTATSGTGRWAIDGTLALNAGQTVTGAFAKPAAGDRLSLTIGSVALVSYDVLFGSVLSADELTVVTDLDEEAAVSVEKTFSPAGDLTVSVVSTRVARWEGKGDDPMNLQDARNWRVVDGQGNQIPGAVPDALTTIFLSGEVAINIPDGADFACVEVVADSTFRLAANCDWRGLAVPFLGTFDLNGHDLWLSAVPGTFTVGNTAEATSTLRLDVANGKTFTNKTLDLTGNLKFVKTGAGVFVAAKDVDYTGGTEVAEGTCRAGLSPETAHPFGAYGSRIDVDSGAVFDLYNQLAGWRTEDPTADGWNKYKFFLNGGKIANTRNSDCSTGDLVIGDITLTDDSTFELSDITVSHDVKIAPGSVWDLGGYTLNVAMLGTDPDLHFNSNLTIRAGTVHQTGGSGYLQLRNCELEDVSYITESTIMRLRCDLTFVNFTVVNKVANFQTDHSTDTFSVSGTFRPLYATCLNTRLLDGSTFDLSGFGDVFPTKMTGGNLTFEPGATVTVDLHGRSLEDGQRVISWSSRPANVKFVPDGETAVKQLFRVQDDGLYVRDLRGTILVVR